MSETGNDTPRRASIDTVMRHRTDPPAPGRRIFVFSLIYPPGDIMRFRLMYSDFLRISSEAEWWCYCEDLVKNINKP